MPAPMEKKSDHDARMPDAVEAHVDIPPGVIDYAFLRAMPTQERKEKLEACFEFMRKDGCGLTHTQEQTIKHFMEAK